MADEILDTNKSEETVETEQETMQEAAQETAQQAAQPASSLTKEEREAIANMSYEEARDRLIQAVRALGNGGLSLEQSMHQWELGEALGARAQSLLANVREKLDAAMAQQASTAQTAGTQGNLQ